LDAISHEQLHAVQMQKFRHIEAENILKVGGRRIWLDFWLPKLA
jgi:hypothetical protein